MIGIYYDRLPGLLLVSLALYIGQLIHSGKYSYYINPTYSWLSGVSGVLLLILGLFSLKYPVKHVRVWTILLFAIVILFCLFGPARIVTSEELLQSPF